ncbi:MAG: response regulator, partial [Pseudomonadota bacterium]
MNHQKPILKEKTLLYAEDELHTQQQYQYFFENYFKTVFTADNGKQALELYSSEQPDVLILDINMPLVSGLEVCKEIRKNDQHTQIILLTSRADKQALLEAVELGLTCYLEKPVARTELKQALAKIIETQPQTKDILLWDVNQQKYFWNTYKQTLCCDTSNILLTKKEKDLLQLLISTRKDKLTYHNIYQALHTQSNHSQFSETAIKTLIKALRKKLPENAIKN